MSIVLWLLKANSKQPISLTNIMQVEAVSIIALQAFQECIAVLGGAIACLHGFS
jgi:hypothetical protein